MLVRSGFIAAHIVAGDTVCSAWSICYFPVLFVLLSDQTGSAPPSYYI